jgi:hypothetical protein
VAWGWRKLTFQPVYTGYNQRPAGWDPTSDPNFFADRTCTYVEQAFFQRWFREQTEETKALTRRLVQTGQLTFVNGGWCMHGM